MSWNKTSIEGARRKAEDKFAKVKEREARLVKEKSKSKQALDTKIAGLKALRLAKEAADKEAAEKEAAALAALKSKVKKSRPARKKAPVQKKAAVQEKAPVQEKAAVQE